MSTETAVAHADHAVHSAQGHGGHDTAASIENRKFAIWLFLSSESALFAVLIAAFVFVRFRPEHFELHRVLNIPLTSVSSFVLLTSSFMVVRALAGIQNGDLIKLQRSILMVVLLGAVFLGFQYYEFSHMAHEGVTLSSGPFGFAFFALTGFHGIHVTIGVIWGFIVFNQSLAGRFTKDNHFGIEVFGLYWHFVDVVWVFIFTVVYLLPDKPFPWS